MSEQPTNVPTQRFTDAIALAVELHEAHARKGTTVPYMSHLLGVASLVMEHGGTEDQCIAGLLHDAVEDCGGAPTAARIRAEFGDAVADIVEACSDTDLDPKPPWLGRKTAYIDHITHAPDDVLLVSLADKVHNCRSLATDTESHGDLLWARFTGTKVESRWYYESLCKVFEERLGPTPLVRELRHAIARVWP